MQILLYGALLLAQLGTSAKQMAMKLCGRRAPGAFNSICINMARAAICLAVSLLIWLIADGSATTAEGHLMTVAAGVGTAVNLFTWILASRLVPLVLIECVSMIGSLLVPLFLAPYLYDGDSVSPLQWVGALLVFVSILLFMKRDTGEKQAASPLRKVVTVVACAAGITVAAVLKKYYTYHVTAKGLGSIEYFTLISFLTVLAVFLLLFIGYYAVERKRTGGAPIELPYRRVWFWILIAAVALYVNELFTSYASQLPSAIYYPLSRVLTVGCAFLLDVVAFRERVTWRSLVGLATLVLAVVLVTL